MKTEKLSFENKTRYIFWETETEFLTVVKVNRGRSVSKVAGRIEFNLQQGQELFFSRPASSSTQPRIQRVPRARF